MVALIVVAGLAEGAALFSLFTPLPLVLAGLVLLRGWSWHAYRRALEHDGAPTRTLEVIRGCRPWMLWGGLVLPLALVGLGLTGPAALAVVASGWALKFVIVTRAAYQQGFAIQRAQGFVKPGWTDGRSAT
jgi:phenylacetyl-CoA:acceptor oxidoreductase subunit 2